MGVVKSERYMYMKRQVDLLGLNLFTTQQRQEKPFPKRYHIEVTDSTTIKILNSHGKYVK